MNSAARFARSWLQLSAYALALSLLACPKLSLADDLLFAGTGGFAVSLDLTLQSGSYSATTSESEFNPGVFNQGWWSDSASRISNSNYAVGQVTDPSGQGAIFYGVGTTFHNYISFDLSTLEPGNVVTAARLTLVGSNGSADIGWGPLTDVTYGLFDVSTSAAALNVLSGTDASIFNDLGSGTSYGTFVLSTGGHSGSPYQLDLNAAAIADINAARGGFFSVGGALVPEPASIVLGLFAAAGIGGVLIRNRRVTSKR